MTKGTFGESLKREREMRGVTLEEIAAATRIARRFLKAIEDEQWELLPGGVFNRGFVRAMARYLGLDEENTVAEYTLAVDDRQSVPVWTGSPPAVTPELPRVAWIIIAVVVIALLAGGWFGARLLLARHAAKHALQADSVDSTSSPTVTDEPLPSGGAQAPSSDAGSALSALPEAPAASSLPVAAAATNSPPAGSLRLKIEAGKNTNVTVIADKNVVFDGSMRAGENQSFAAAEGFQISAEDAGALRLELNGKTLAPFGSPGHSAKVTLTREALKGAGGGED